MYNLGSAFSTSAFLMIGLLLQHLLGPVNAFRVAASAFLAQIAISLVCYALLSGRYPQVNGSSVPKAEGQASVSLPSSTDESEHTPTKTPAAASPPAGDAAA